MNGALTVYKASAGSGKTFTLAVEYVKLLLQNPRAYEGILAVTFTNKATEEMKMRILSTLYGLSLGLKDSEKYMEEILKGLKKDTMHPEAAMKKEQPLVSENNGKCTTVNGQWSTSAGQWVAKRAGEALHLLLHNYHFFRVQTIDAFFQTVLRNLAKELQLNANLRVALNNEQVVDQAVDDIIDTIADDKKLKRIVVDYMNENIADDKKMDVIGDIKRFGGNIFTERYKEKRKKMRDFFANEKNFDNYKNELYAIINNANSRYAYFSGEAEKILNNNGLEYGDFSRGASGVMGYFKKLAEGNYFGSDVLNKSAQNALVDSESWVSKSKSNRACIVEIVETELRPLMNEIEKQRAGDALKVNSALTTLKNLNNLRMLKRIEDMAHTLNEASQRFMLSDTQSLLHDIIAEDDSPFIFEKIGARLEHVMIDEFQDTSTVQWRNFLTLLKECMAQGHSNLIVGDVKQSIYRFRSGDWKLLNGIENWFAPDMVHFEPKKTNFRSTRNVINFNNTFLSLVAGIETGLVGETSEERAAELTKAYLDVVQEIPKDREQKGYVRIEMLPKEDMDTMEQRILERIEELLAQGVEQRDIAILVRRKKNIPDIARCVETGGRIKVVSEEAFRLDASPAVLTIVSAMRLVSSPKDEVARAMLRRLCKKNEIELFDEKRKELLSMTLCDMAETLVQFFELGCKSNGPGRPRGREDAYLTLFFDQLHAFSNDMAPVLEDFLSEWDKNICNITIDTGKSNGVRILTIHKSKGLEFKHVIMPYCNWKFIFKDTLIWAEPTVEPFSLLPLVSLPFAGVSSLQGTIYEEDGNEEWVQTIVDNLNLLYVAMTRAGESLYVIGERLDTTGKDKQKANRGNRSKALCEAIDKLPMEIEGVPVRTEGKNDPKQVLKVEYGEENINGSLNVNNRQDHHEGDDETETNVFTEVAKPVGVAICSYPNTVEYRQSNESRRFAEDAIDETDRERMVRMGMVMHQLFASISTLDDVEPMLTRMEYDGTLYGEGMTRDKLLERLRGVFADQRVRKWFSSRWRVYKECAIISREGEKRPDRVISDGNETIVIDFKFGKPDKDYEKQVREYMNLLREMGMPDVKGYLWYVMREEVVKV